jgi:antirestriction protein ArdC
VLADLGIAHHPRPDHAAYLASWLRVLTEDPRAIFTAAGKAQQAADWMHAQQPASGSSGATEDTEAGQPGSPAVAGTM